MVSHDDVSAEDKWAMAHCLRALVCALLHGWELSRRGGSAAVEWGARDAGSSSVMCLTLRLCRPVQHSVGRPALTRPLLLRVEENGVIGEAIR
jgi:hypothetical protein